MTLEHYEDPPIAEVICGFMFEAVPGLDPLTLGWFALEQRDRYPKRSIQPALTDPGRIYMSPTPPIRAWLTSPDDAFLVQAQHDRFYLNWRAGASGYPSFNDHAGNPGVLRLALAELERFNQFCRATLDHDVRPTRVELAEVGQLDRGKHWETRSDLLELLPFLKPLAELAASDDGLLAAHFTRPLGSDGQIVVSFATDPGGERANLEWRALGPVGEGGVEQAMRKHNTALNELFERTIPEERRRALFRGGQR